MTSSYHDEHTTNMEIRTKLVHLDRKSAEAACTRCCSQQPTNL